MRMGTLLMVAGAGVFVIGLLVRYFPGVFSWFGHLPGDIRLEGESSRVFIPIGSMVAVSVGLTIVANLIALLLRDR